VRIPRGGSGSPVVVLTNQLDVAADEVINRLTESGIPVRRVNAEDVVAAGAPTWSSRSQLDTSAGAIWWRQFELPSDSIVDLKTADDVLLVRAQWRAWLSVLEDLRVPWINELWAARRAENKILQLRTAGNVGLQVPETIVCNDLAEAKRFSDQHPAIVKSLASAYFELSDQGFVFTRDLTPDLLDDENVWRLQPMIVQRRITGANLRVILVGDECFGASCQTAALDWRLEGADAHWRSWSVPAGVAEPCRKYAAELGLRYAAFDLIDDGDSVWFLEANQAGEWSFIDRPLKLGISEALTSLLAELASQVDP
jgi:glutathione synthase/RimK-type ligase-like ATP-grasp enzyme